MKIGRESKIAKPMSNQELLKLCDYATDEDVCVPMAMEDVERLNISAWYWDTKSESAWVLVSDLRKALT